MRKLFTLSVEAATASVTLIPFLFIYCKIKHYKTKKIFIYILFSLYLVSLYSLVGLPTIMNHNLYFYYNLIPFYNMISDWKTYILNVFLFIPLGIFIPCLWKNYRNIAKTTLMGLIVSLSIETLQIFTFRTTDINDLIANTVGSMIGYYIANTVIQKLQKLKEIDNKSSELYILYGMVIIVMAFIQPFISLAIWEIIL